MTGSTSSCAVGPDGTLLNVSKIQWFNDPDNNNPLPSLSSPVPTTLENGASVSSQQEIHPFFKHTAPPATITAGTRQSTRAIRPSARAIDPNHIEGSTSTQQKLSHKASLSSRHITHKIDQSNEASEYDNALASEHDTAEAETEPDNDGDGTAMDGYQWLQKMPVQIMG
jgi:hypothetical protein